MLILLLLALEWQADFVQHDPADNELSSLIDAILNHVVQHPDAKDSIDGICGFWLPPQTRRPSQALVRQALDYLVDEKRWFTRRVTGAAVTLYGLERKALPEVRRYLRGD